MREADIRYMWNGCDACAKYNSVLLYHKKDGVGLGVGGGIHVYIHARSKTNNTK